MFRASETSPARQPGAQSAEIMAQASTRITTRTRSESPNQTKTLANRERFFARTSQPTCPNPKHTPTGHNYPKNKEASALAPASLFV